MGEHLEDDDIGLQQNPGAIFNDINNEAQTQHYYSTVNAKYVCKMRGWTFDPQACSILVVMELCELGSLRRVIAWDAGHRRVKGPRRIAMMVQGAKALRVLHFGIWKTSDSFERNDTCIHGDIKADNFLVTADYRVKLSDFGSALRKRQSRVKKDVESGLTTVQLKNKGTYEYTAPEVHRSKDQYSEASDVYAFGIVLWEIWTGGEPWVINSTRSSEAYVIGQVVGCSDILLNLDEHHVNFNGGASAKMPSYLRTVVQSCVNPDPVARPSSHDLVRLLLEVQRRFWAEWVREQEGRAAKPQSAADALNMAMLGEPGAEHW